MLSRVLCCVVAGSERGGQEDQISQGAGGGVHDEDGEVFKPGVRGQALGDDDHSPHGSLRCFLQINLSCHSPPTIGCGE